jgi:hypothetical protein
MTVGSLRPPLFGSLDLLLFAVPCISYQFTRSRQISRDRCPLPALSTSLPLLLWWRLRQAVASEFGCAGVFEPRWGAPGGA